MTHKEVSRLLRGATSGVLTFTNPAGDQITVTLDREALATAEGLRAAFEAQVGWGPAYDPADHDDVIRALFRMADATATKRAA